MLRIYGVAFLFLQVSSTRAALLTFELSGNVTQVAMDDVFGDMAAGDTIHGSFHFDRVAVDMAPTDTAGGSYGTSAPLEITVKAGPDDFTAPGFLNIGILNGFLDEYTVLATSATGDLTLELFAQENGPMSAASRGESPVLSGWIRLLMLARRKQAFRSAVLAN